MNQRDPIKQYFLSHPNQWIPLPDILDITYNEMRITQYCRCIKEIREEDGLRIINRITMINGVKCSFYIYDSKGHYDNNGNEIQMFKQEQNGQFSLSLI